MKKIKRKATAYNIAFQKAEPSTRLIHIGDTLRMLVSDNNANLHEGTWGGLRTAAGMPMEGQGPLSPKTEGQGKGNWGHGGQGNGERGGSNNRGMENQQPDLSNVGYNGPNKRAGQILDTIDKHKNDPLQNIVDTLMNTINPGDSTVLHMERKGDGLYYSFQGAQGKGGKEFGPFQKDITKEITDPLNAAGGRATGWIERDGHVIAQGKFDFQSFYGVKTMDEWDFGKHWDDSAKQLVDILNSHTKSLATSKMPKANEQTNSSPALPQ